MLGKRLTIMDFRSASNEVACQTEEPERLGNLSVVLSATDGSEAATQVSHILQCDKVTQATDEDQHSRSLVPRYKKGPFSEEENLRLQQLVTVFTKRGNISWEQVARFMDGRSKRQLRNRYNRSMDPSLRHGPWTALEDVMLLIAVKLYGDTSWSKVASMVPGRLDSQCKDHYQDCYDPRLVTGQYTPDEDYTLLQLVQKHGAGHWAKVAREMPWRSSSSVKMRYWRLCENLGVEHPTVADLKRSLPGPVGPVMNAEQRSRLTCVYKRRELFRSIRRLLNTKTTRRAAQRLIKGQDESVDRKMCLRLYRKMLRLQQDNKAPKIPLLLGHALNKAIAQYSQPLHRVSLPQLAAYEHQEWHAVANVLHDLHGLPRPPPNPDVEAVGTVPVFEEFFSKEVLGVPDGFQPNDGSLVLPLLPPNETTVGAFGSLSDRFASGNLVESLSTLQDGNSFPELSAALDADSIEDIRCTECTSRSLLELPFIATRASQEPCFHCNELRAARKNYEVLQAQFISYFFWPAVLDTMNVAETVELSPSMREKRPKKYYERSRLKKPWVKRRWEERKREIAAAAAAAAAASATAQDVNAPEEDDN
uniref:snRNA-activating protein complex subunit 4 n=1 Tax=Rhipicephalus zambeziensis TaxID=60191 RepID=A0A224Z8X1_9ACAR